MSFPHIFGTQYPTVLLSYLDDNFNAITTATGASLLGFSQTATYSVGSIGLHAQGFVNAKDSPYNAAGDGVTDDTTSIQAALNKTGRIYFPAGTYISGNLTIPSNTEIFGDGIGTTIFKIKTSTDNDLFTVSSKANVSFRHFKISGNSAGQTSGSGIHVSGTSTDIVCDNVLIDDHYDWGFYFEQVTRARLFNCGSTNGRAGASSSAVRGEFLFGTSIGPTAANDIECFGCYASGSNNFVDGFLSENGNNHRFIGCRTATGYTGFKIKGNNVIVQGCYATGGFQGYQTQTSSQNNIFQGNIAYRTNESGFFFTNTDTVTPARGLIVNGNMAIECGQSPASTSYGFAFEGSASATIDQVIISNNIATDNQGVVTQSRGLSFGVSGTFSNVYMGNNFVKGNTADIVLGSSLQTSTFTCGFNPFGNSASGSYPTESHSLHFWYDNLPQSSGTVAMNDGFSGRGYMMPKAGYIRLVSAKSNASITAGNATFQVKISGTISGAYDTTLNTGAPTLATTEQSPHFASGTFSAGDMITMVVTGDASLLPNGTADMDVTVEVIY